MAFFVSFFLNIKIDLFRVLISTLSFDMNLEFSMGLECITTNLHAYRPLSCTGEFLKTKQKKTCLFNSSILSIGASGIVWFQSSSRTIECRHTKFCCALHGDFGRVHYARSNSESNSKPNSETNSETSCVIFFYIYQRCIF